MYDNPLTRRAVLAGAAMTVVSAAPVPAFAERRVPGRIGLEHGRIRAIGVEAAQTIYKGRAALRAIAQESVSGPDRLVMLDTPSFGEGVIEAWISGAPMARASATARGFVGLAFRAQDETTLEAIYLRPTNGRAEDQLRRNHSVQYVSHPAYPWERLRAETPGKYETYVDLEPGKWTQVRIVVAGTYARLYVDGAEQPTLIVDDLKHGASAKGAVALWIGPGTEAHFSEVKVRGSATVQL